MKSFIRFFAVAMLACACLPATADQLNKCKQADGTYAYQATRCPSSTQQEVITFNSHGNVQPQSTRTSSASGGPAAADAAARTTDMPRSAVTPDPSAAAGSAASSTAVEEPTPVANPRGADEPRQADAASPDQKASAATPANTQPSRGMSLLGFIGIALMTVGGIWLLIVAFQKSILWGLLCFFLPGLFMLIFAITNWERAKKPFLAFVAGFVLVLVVGSSEYDTYKANHPRTSSGSKPAAASR